MQLNQFLDEKLLFMFKCQALCITYQILNNFWDLYQFLKINQRNFMDSYLNKAQAINQFFEVDIIDIHPIQRYFQRFDFSLFQNMKTILNSKNKLRQSAVAIVCPRIAQIYQIKSQKCYHILSAKKKTDITHFLTKILIPSEQNRFLVQKFRMKLLIKLRSNQQITHQELLIVKNLYELMLQNAIIKDFQIKQLENQKQTILLKKILISLKKMMGIGRKQTVLDNKAKKQKRKAYQLNVDIKQIVIESLTLLKDKSLKEKLQIALIQRKDKNWFGPNLYKFFQHENFNNIEIKEISRALQTVNLEQLYFNNSLVTMKRSLKKILNNICFFIKDSEKPNIQQTTKEKDDNNLFMLESLNNQNQQRSQYQMEQINDESQIIKKDDSIFDMLCLDEQ